MRRKGELIMRRNVSLVILVLFLAFVFICGCAGSGKTVLQEEQEKAAAKEAAVAAEAKSAAGESSLNEDEAAKRRAEQEQAEREAGLKAEAEREAALKAQTAQEAAAGTSEVKAAQKATGKATEKAAAVVVPSKELYELADIHFDFDKFNLVDEARGILKKHAEWLNKNNDVAVVVEGHCDERGTSEYNLALGERRASAAAKYLIDMGVDSKRIKTVSYGEEKPLDPGHNEEAWAKNRRAHFVASGK
jgi:peptidoglycan-associated lipoprotein